MLDYDVQMIQIFLNFNAKPNMRKITLLLLALLTSLSTLTAQTPQSFKSQLVKIQCEQTDSILRDSEFPMIIKKCIYGKYKIIEKGRADYNGRYSWNQEAFVETRSGFKRIDNKTMFINQEELLDSINNKFNQDYETLRSDPESANCWGNRGQFTRVKSLDDLQIGFSEDATRMHFSYSLGMSSACLSQDLLFCSMSSEEIDKYIAD
jgi:hypothetical protein